MIKRILLWIFLWIGSHFWNNVIVTRSKDQCVHHISFYDDEIHEVNYAINWNNKAIAPEE